MPLQSPVIHFMNVSFIESETFIGPHEWSIQLLCSSSHTACTEHHDVMASISENQAAPPLYFESLLLLKPIVLVLSLKRFLIQFL